MTAQKILEQMEYVEANGILYPKMLPDNPAKLGIWGQRRLRFLEEERPELFAEFIAAGSLWPHLLETDETARSQAAFAGNPGFRSA